MKIYNVHYAINGEERDYVIEAMSTADALDSCWYENAFKEDGEETYIAMWIEELPDCDENRNLLSKDQRPKMTKSEFIDLSRKNGVQNDSTNVWVVIDGIQYTTYIDYILEYDETYPFEASDCLEALDVSLAWDVMYDQYLDGEGIKVC